MENIGYILTVNIFDFVDLVLIGIVCFWLGLNWKNLKIK